MKTFLKIKNDEYDVEITGNFPPMKIGEELVLKNMLSAATDGIWKVKKMRGDDNDVTIFLERPAANGSNNSEFYGNNERGETVEA